MSLPQHRQIKSAPPVFLLKKESFDDLTVPEVCRAAEEVSGELSITGAQSIGGLWRIYPVDTTARATLLTSTAGKLVLRNLSTPLYSTNPFIIRDGEGNEIPSTRLTIDHLPLSVSNADLEIYLRKSGARLRSAIEWEKAREERALTRWVNGRRYVHIDLPPETNHLPRELQVGHFVARLYYREMPKPKVKCFECGLEGHRKGDPKCPGKSNQNAWTGQENEQTGQVIETNQNADFPSLDNIYTADPSENAKSLTPKPRYRPNESCASSADEPDSETEKENGNDDSEYSPSSQTGVKGPSRSRSSRKPEREQGKKLTKKRTRRGSQSRHRSAKADKSRGETQTKLPELFRTESPSALKRASNNRSPLEGETAPRKSKTQTS